MLKLRQMILAIAFILSVQVGVNVQTGKIHIGVNPTTQCDPTGCGGG